MILDRVVNLARLSPNASNNDKEAYVTYISGARMNIQSASAETIALMEGAVGRTFRGFTTVSGIQIGDQVTVSGLNTQYVVKGVEDWWMEPLPHLEIILFLGDR